MDLKAFLAVFRRRLWLFLAIVATVAGLVAVGTLLMTPKYGATASVKVDPNTRQLLDASQTAPLRSDNSVIDTEVELMRSPEVAAAVVRATRLTEDAEFSATPTATPSEPQVQATAAALLKASGIGRRGATYIIDIQVLSVSPTKSARLANALAAAYVEASRRSQVSIAASQAQSLNRQLNDLGEEVRMADAAVASYRGATGIAAGQGIGGTVTDQQISAIAGQLATAESDAAAARSRANAAQAQISSGNLEAVSQVLSSSVITALRGQRAEVLREQAQVSAAYGPLHPEYVRVQQELAGVDAQILAEARRIVSGLQSDARAGDARASSLRGQLNALQGRLSSNARASVEADSLERSAEAKREIYNQVAQTAQQTSQQEQLGQARGQVVETASPPSTPSFPNKPLFAVLGVLLGMVVGAVTVIILEVFDTRVRTVADIEEGMGLPFIAAVPALTGGQMGRNRRAADFVIAKPVSGYAEAIRTLRASLLTGVGSGEPQAFCITSAIPHEGKSSLAASLARICAMSGDRTILVDCDLRRGSLRELAGGKDEAGLLEVIRGEADWRAVRIQDRQDRLHILAPVARSFATEDLVGSEAMARLLLELKAEYDVIVLDSPPVLAVADARRLAAMADKTVLAVRWRSTEKEAVRITIGNLQEAGADVAGVVLTRVDTRARLDLGAGNPAYYYSYAKGYYQD